MYVNVCSLSSLSSLSHLESNFSRVKSISTTQTVPQGSKSLPLIHLRPFKLTFPKSSFSVVKSLKTLEQSLKSPQNPMKNASNSMNITLFQSFSHAFPAACAASGGAGSATVVATSVKAPSSSRSSWRDGILWWMIRCFYDVFMAGWWLGHPSEKYESQSG